MADSLSSVQTPPLEKLPPIPVADVYKRQALTSINKNENVKEVELKTDVGTLTISDAAWNDMTAKATEVDKTASVVIKLEDKSKEGSNPVYEVTATVGEENAFDGSGDGAVTISVPYTADGGKGNVKVYCTDNGKMEDMNAALSDGILSWTTSHFSTFEVVAYDGTAEVTYQTMKDGTTSVSVSYTHLGEPKVLTKSASWKS